MSPFRKRELLLSLKYSTIEASFSVPMLTLTMANLAFAIGFAAQVLGWGPAAIGLMAATPHLCNFIQPPLTHWLQRRLSLYRIMVIMFVLGAMPWAFVSTFPWMGTETRDAAFAMIVLVSSLANAVCGVAWSAAISDLVPLSIRGRYFGRRNLIFGAWTLVAIVAAGQVADYFDNSLHIFGMIFAGAALMRMLGLFFLTRMRFPASATELRPVSIDPRRYAAVFRDRNYFPLLLFIGLWGLCLNLGTPFYNVYVLRELRLSLGDLTTMSMLASLGGLVSLRTWGALSDRFGNKPVLFTCAVVWALASMVSWLLASPQHYTHLYVMYFIVGFVTAGFQLCQFNLMIKMVPSESKAHYIAVFFSFTSLLTALGPILGGKLMELLPQHVGSFLGRPWLSYHLLFIGSMFLCFSSVHLLQWLREPAERPVRELVRVMRGMREFNPLLGAASIVEFVFTPSQITRFARESVRSLRRQTDAVTDVGGELVEGTWRYLKEPFEKDPK